MKKTVYFFLLLLAAGIAGCGSSKETENPETAEVSETEDASKEEGEPESESLFGNFTAYTQEGEEVTEEIFAGADLTMVNIWGTFCGPCIEEMPVLGALAKEYEEQGFQIVGIISDVTEPGTQDAQDIIDSTGADYLHMVLSEDLYRNVLWQVQAVPTTVFVDQEGKQVGSVVMGARDEEGWREIIDGLLEAPDEAE